MRGEGRDDTPTVSTDERPVTGILGHSHVDAKTGSGAGDPIPAQTIQAVRKHFDGILIVGGGITSPDRARKAAASGADIIAIGNLLQAPGFEGHFREIARAVRAA